MENWTEIGNLRRIQKFELLLNSVATFFKGHSAKTDRVAAIKLIHGVLTSVGKGEFLAMTQTNATRPHQQLQLEETRTYQSADLLLPVGSRAGCSFDHGGRLVVCQFLDAALTCYYVTDLRRRTEKLVSQTNTSHPGAAKATFPP